MVPFQLVVAAAEAARSVTEPEAALDAVTALAYEHVGDRSAPILPGALREGEHQFFVCGVFLHDEGARRSVLVAEHGFPSEQHRLAIADDLGHPGWVIANQRPLVLENTDEHSGFKQILKTARMGSAMYAPMFIGGRFVGQLILAAQARNTFRATDLDALAALASVAVLAYRDAGGPQWFNRLTESLG